MRCDWLLYCGSANEKICCSHCCEVQKSCTRLLSRVLGVRSVCRQRVGGIYTLPWVTGRLICATALLFWVKLLALQFSHIHMCMVIGPTRGLHKPTTTQCGWEWGLWLRVSPYMPYGSFFKCEQIWDRQKKPKQVCQYDNFNYSSDWISFWCILCQIIQA